MHAKMSVWYNISYKVLYNADFEGVFAHIWEIFHKFAKQKLCTFATASMKTFNTAGTCRPNEHYMVDITERLEIIRKMVAKGDYFCINRGRQYGKTTTLAALADELKNDYCVFSISFEGLDDNAFASASNYHFFYEELYRIQDHCCPCNDKVYHPKPRHKHASLVPPSPQRTDRMFLSHWLNHWTET